MALFDFLRNLPRYRQHPGGVRRLDRRQRFIIEPHVRFKGEVGEQATMFFLDPSGNALEFKAFKDLKSLFAK